MLVMGLGQDIGCFPSRQGGCIALSFLKARHNDYADIGARYPVIRCADGEEIAADYVPGYEVRRESLASPCSFDPN